MHVLNVLWTAESSYGKGDWRKWGRNRAKQVDQITLSLFPQENCIKLDFIANLEVTYKGKTSFES